MGYLPLVTMPQSFRPVYQHGSDRLCEGNHRKGDHGIPEVKQISHLLVQVECGNQRVRRRVDS